jgi:hypothetical protein
VLPEAVTVKLLEVAVDIFCKPQSCQLFRLTPGILDELKWNPLIKQVQEGAVEARMLEKLPITDTLDPRKESGPRN